MGEIEVRRQLGSVSAMLKDTLSKFRDLLDTSCDEASVHRFMEANPILVTLGVVPEGPVISQLGLGTEFRVDFAFIYGRANAGDFIHFVEIERPDLLLFNADDSFSRHYNQAVQQLLDWREWWTRNSTYLVRRLELLFDNGRFSHAIPTFTLIAGRRSQITSAVRKQRFVAKANSFVRDFDLMTYDDLIDRCARNSNAESDLDSGAKTICVKVHDQRLVSKL